MKYQEISQKAKEHKQTLIEINPNFPISYESMALSVWTQMNPVDRYEIMQSVSKMPKSLAGKQKACISKIVEIIKMQD